MGGWTLSLKSGRRRPQPYQLLSSKTLHRGRYYALQRDQFIYRPDPLKIVTRDTVVHSGAVVILPFASRHEVVLVKQFRWAAKDNLWEIPAGTLEKRENPLVCARRELEEETGLRARRWKLLTCFYPAPGMSSERMWLYRAEGLFSGKRRLDPDEWMDVHTIPLRRALQWIRRGQIRDGKTIAGILWALHPSLPH